MLDRPCTAPMYCVYKYRTPLCDVLRLGRSTSRLVDMAHNPFAFRDLSRLLSLGVIDEEDVFEARGLWGAAPQGPLPHHCPLGRSCRHLVRPRTVCCYQFAHRFRAMRQSAMHEDSLQHMAPLYIFRCLRQTALHVVCT